MRNELNAMLAEKFRPDYQKSEKVQKTEILDQLQKLTGMERKYLIKLLRGKRPITSITSPGRPKIYLEDLSLHLLKLYHLMEQISPKRMKEAIPLWLPFYEKHYGLLETETRKKLFSVSSSTIGRILVRAKGNEKGLSSTKVNHKLKTQIPLKRLDEKVTKPGTIQADTVVHCGTSLIGEYANTLTLTDLFSGWTENRATWTKESGEIKKQLIDIEKEIPITIKYFDTDCGNEFLNYRIMRHLENRTSPIKMRRARPYKKNDQCYVEQRNHTHVRNLFGYDRLEYVRLVEQMNIIYKKYWNPLNNYFLPSFKLLEKTRVGGKIKKKFEVPKTPAQRLLNAKGYSGYMKRKIRNELGKLDPIELKRELEKELNIFYKLFEEEKRKHALNDSDGLRLGVF